MKYKANWAIQNSCEHNAQTPESMTADELVNLASSLKHRDDVIYTYHPKYMKLGARIALWGTGTKAITIDVQFSAHAFVGIIEIENLPQFFQNYTGYIKDPEKYGLRREE